MRRRHSRSLSLPVISPVVLEEFVGVFEQITRPGMEPDERAGRGERQRSGETVTGQRPDHPLGGRTASRNGPRAERPGAVREARAGWAHPVPMAATPVAPPLGSQDPATRSTRRPRGWMRRRGTARGGGVLSSRARRVSMVIQSGAPAPTSSVGRHSYLWLGLILVVGAALRFREAWLTPLWFDEIFTLWMTRSPFGVMLQRLASDIHPPLMSSLRWWRSTTRRATGSASAWRWWPRRCSRSTACTSTSRRSCAATRC